MELGKARSQSQSQSRLSLASHLRRLPNCDDLAYRAAEIVTAETALALWLRNISLRLGAGVRFGLRNQFN